MSKYIKDWDELKQIPNESETHILEIDDCNGWLHTKDEKPYNSKVDFFQQIKHQDVYLSTHTFYGRNYKNSTKMLQACGFDVELANWDE